MTDLKSLFDNLVRAEIVLWNAVDDALRAECELQLTWFEIMRFVADQGSCRVQDVAGNFAITVGGTSKVVDRIEAAGYCVRRANPQDRRSSLVALTPTGHDVLERAMTVFERELQHRIGAVLGAQTITAVSAALTALHTPPADRDSTSAP